MPIKKCQAGNKEGLKFGNQGKCYTGPSAKAKAQTQMRAIKSSQGKSK